MDEADLAPCDFASPESVVTAFIASMNAWEINANRISRSGDGDHWPEIHRTQALVFDRFCTPTTRPRGRAGSFRNPPEYDPERERVLGSRLHGAKHAFVETDREEVLEGGRYRYVLHLLDGRWLIDNVKVERDGKWRAAVL